MGGCQNYGPFLGTLNIGGRTIMGTQKGTIILTTTHMTRSQLRDALWQAQAPGSCSRHTNHCKIWPQKCEQM